MSNLSLSPGSVNESNPIIPCKSNSVIGCPDDFTRINFESESSKPTNVTQQKGGKKKKTKKTRKQTHNPHYKTIILKRIEKGN